MRAELTALAAMAVLATAALAAPAHEPRQAAESIDELIKAKGKLYYGTCTDQNRLSTGKSADIIKGNFGQVTPENSMKWDVSGPFLFFPFPLLALSVFGSRPILSKTSSSSLLLTSHPLYHHLL